jgi:hypothetical protein
LRGALAGEPAQTADDYDAQRLLLLNRVCEGYGVLPSAARREMEEDPEQLALVLLDVRGFIAAYQAFSRFKRGLSTAEELKAWEGSEYMTLIETCEFEARQGASGAEG